jgi:hypothetical protein
VRTEKKTHNAAVAEHHDQIGLQFGLSPVDLPEDPAVDENGLRWMLSILAMSSLLLVMFNSFAIDKWARQLETTAITGPIKDASAQWHAVMQSFGLDIPLETGRGMWLAAKAARFNAQEQAQSATVRAGQ